MDQAKNKLTVALTGATGLVGANVARLLGAAGYTVYGLRREPAAPARWDVASGEIVTPAPVDVVVHLAGRNVGQRWSAKVKKEVWESRVPATERLCRFLARLPAERRPKILLAASAIGIYGNRGDEVLTEDSPLAPKGKLFLADVCIDWETATRPAEDAGISVCHVRVGVVLAKGGGALAKLMTPVKLGLGGPVGPGTQFMPWISNGDLCRLFQRLAEAKPGSLPPAVNGVGPAPVRQHEFIRTLGRVLRRPTIFPLPSFVVKAVFGQMGEEALLSSLRVIETKLPAGFECEDKTLEGALRRELGIG
jgi:uncharacterized protein (TIGR01777 family)